MTRVAEVIMESTSKMALKPAGEGSVPVVPKESKSAPLFACTKCNARHLLEDLSKDMMFCKNCQVIKVPVVKATCVYCRSEFEAANKSTSICSKCDHCVKKYGKPTTCDYCNIIAAFVGKKCHRCVYSEKKYGPPMHCEQCKQRSAFDRRDADGRSKANGRILCWLCTCSYKRAIDKAKQRKDRHLGYHKREASSHRPHSSRSKSEHSSSNQTNNTNGNSNGTNGNIDPPPNKKPKVDSSASTATSTTNSNPSLTLPLPGTLIESKKESNPVSASDNVVTIAQLREQVISLNKQLKLKNQELLKKDVKITELNAEINKEQKQCREKIQTMQKNHGERMQELQQKITGLSKKLASTVKASRQNNGANAAEDDLLGF